MQLGKKIQNLDRGLELLIVVIFALMTAVVLFNVFNRNILKMTIGWPDELSRYLMIWLVYTTIPICFSRERHFKLSLITRFLIKKEKSIFQLLVLILTLGYSVTFFLISADLCRLLLENAQRSPGIAVPMYIVCIILPVCFISVTVQILMKLVIWFKKNQGFPKKENF